jgi:hypothetical protein
MSPQSIDKKLKYHILKDQSVCFWPFSKKKELQKKT